jgi:hypothetical protein
MGTTGKCTGNEFRAVSARDGRGDGLKEHTQGNPLPWVCSPPFYLLHKEVTNG